MSRASPRKPGVFDLDSLRFPDDFEEYLARAESGGSAYGILKRHAFAHSSLRVRPTYGQMKDRSDQRKRSKSLIPPPPPPSRLMSIADEKTIIKELFEHTARHRTTETPPPQSPLVRSTLQVQRLVRETPIGYHRNSSAPCSWREKGIIEEPEVPLLVRSSSTRNSPRGTAARDGGLEAVPMCRRRSFSLTHRGLVNDGDEVVPSIPTALEMMREGVGVLTEGGIGGGSGSRRSSYNSGDGSGCNWSEGSSSLEMPGIHRVMLLGGPGVGKTAIAQQFLTSEFMAAQNTSFDDGRELSVPVLLDGEESIMEFVDLPYSGEPDVWQDNTIDAYIIVYAITDRRSYQKAADVMREIRDDKTRNKSRPIILVANKSDLERSRMISKEEGRHLAQSNDCKYIEVSAILNHKVDDLLVGMLKQIRLDLERGTTNTGQPRPPVDAILSPDAPGPSTSPAAVAPCPSGRASPWSGHNLLAKLFGAARKSSMKSCEDLLT